MSKSEPSLWVLYGGPKPRRVAEILTFQECGSTPANLIPGWSGPTARYRATTTRVLLANGKKDGAPLAWLFHGTRAQAEDMLTRPMGAPRPS